MILINSEQFLADIPDKITIALLIRQPTESLKLNHKDILVILHIHHNLLGYPNLHIIIPKLNKLLYSIPLMLNSFLFCISNKCNRYFNVLF